jgi:hypothetical protein
MAEIGPAEAPAGRDTSVSMERANVLAIVLFPAIALLTLTPFWLLYGGAELWDGMRAVFRLWFFIPAFLVAIVVHEGLHALGFLAAGRVPRSAIHFGVDRSTGSPFAGCRVAVPAGAYRFAVALPVLVLGVVPLLAGYALGWAAPVVWAMVMIVAAGGDLIVLWVVRGVPGHAPVLDHPSRVGCTVLDGEGEAAGG